MIKKRLKIVSKATEKQYQSRREENALQMQIEIKATEKKNQSGRKSFSY
jgi:hypothetical protein